MFTFMPLSPSAFSNDSPAYLARTIMALPRTPYRQEGVGFY